MPRPPQRRPGPPPRRPAPTAEPPKPRDSLVLGVIAAEELGTSPLHGRSRELGAIAFRFDSKSRIGERAIGYLEMRGKPPQELERLKFSIDGRPYGAPPALLFVLDNDPELALLPNVKRSGMLKGAANIARTLGGAEPTDLHWWLAYRFARYGYVSQRKAERTAERLGLQVQVDDTVVVHEGLIIWHDYLQKRVAELRRSIAAGTQANPFIRRVTPAMARYWLDLANPMLVGLILRESASADMALGTWLGEPVLVVTPNAEGPAAAGHLAIGVEVLARYEGEDTGIPKEKLEQLYPSARNTLKLLFDAGTLIESESGFIFTDAQLERYLQQLNYTVGQGEVPGVGAIKQATGIHRKAAEALRGLLLQLSDDYA